MSKDDYAYFFVCPKCKKVIRKYARQIGNTVYSPLNVEHKHGKVNWYCKQFTRQDLIAMGMLKEDQE